MTHILITDLREIRYMAYVPEEIDYEPIWNSPIDFSPKDVVDKLKADYQSELEKAKRESLPFDREEDREEIETVMYTKWMSDHNYKAPFPLWKKIELKPGIYQVPVEVDVVETFSHCTRDEKHYVKVARIVQPKEKEESQKELIQAFFDMVAEYGENLSYSELSKHFTLTRKRG